MAKFILMVIAFLTLPVYIYGLSLPILPTEIIDVNTFSTCSIRLTNFNGLDINFDILTNPIVHICYLQFPSIDNLYPFEWKSSKTRTILERISEMNLSRFNKKKVFPSLNSTAALFYNQLTNNYICLTLTDQFTIASRKTTVKQTSTYIRQTEIQFPTYTANNHFMEPC